MQARLTLEGPEEIGLVWEAIKSPCFDTSAPTGGLEGSMEATPSADEHDALTNARSTLAGRGAAFTSAVNLRSGYSHQLGAGKSKVVVGRGAIKCILWGGVAGPRGLNRSPMDRREVPLRSSPKIPHPSGRVGSLSRSSETPGPGQEVEEGDGGKERE